MLIASCSSPSPVEELSTVVIPDRIDSGINISNLASSINQIQLETNEHALLGVIKDIKFYDDKFYINDSNQILVFDNKGKFLLKLGKQGGGPGEYGIVYSMAIDSHSNLIYVSSVRKLIVFSSDHKLLKERKFPMGLAYLNVVNKKLVIVSDEIVGDFDNGFTSNTTLYELSPDLLVNDSSLIRKVSIDENRSVGSNFKFYMSSDNLGDYFFKPVLTQESIFPDTLYQLEEIRLSPYKKIEFRKSQKLDPDGLISPLMLSIVNSTSYIICEYFQDGDLMFFLYDKNTSKSYNLKGGILDENGTPVILRPLDTTNDTFYYVKSAEYISGSNEELNPIIGIVKFE